MIEIITTSHSVYEVDWDNDRIRRVLGERAPTTRQGEDNEWKHADISVVPYWDGDSLLMKWVDGTTTLSSPIKSREVKVDG